MPATTVHVAVAGLIACALLRDHFDAVALAVVVVAAAALDADAVLAVAADGVHRTALHNLWVPLVPLALLTADVKFREPSVVLERFGAYGWRVGWVACVAVLVGHTLLDAFHNGANLLWPLHDQFYDLSGEVLVSDRRGFVQTVVDIGADGSTERGGTDDLRYVTPADPGTPDADGEPERIAYLAETGEHLLLTVLGFGVMTFRLWEHRRDGPE